MSNNPRFTIGCDPEIFVTERGKPFSAYGVLQGTKAEPFKTDGGAYQVDGMAAEFNTDPVALRNHYNAQTDFFSKWNDLICKQIKQIREALPDTCNLRITPTMEFGQEFLDQQPDAAKELGCDPDYNAYTLQANPRPDGEKTFRTGAGHIHVGWGADIPVDNADHMAICADFVKMLDCTVGMFMTYIDRDALRRDLYGKAGAMRPKPYGVEYRTPSNAWIVNRDLRRCVWDLVQIAITMQSKGVSREGLTGYCEADIQRIINEGSHKEAITLVNEAFRYNFKLTQPWSTYQQPAHLRRVISSIEKKYNANA
jgi:hypothetical protein